jgi:sensor domain CHASE-containing protein
MCSKEQNEEILKHMEEAKKLWDDFSNNIKYKNRFFIEENILDILKKL